MPPRISDEQLLEEAKTRFRNCVDWESEARVRFDWDYKFANGDAHNLYQWDQAIVQDRLTARQPVLTINKTQVHCLQVINDGKQNKPGVNIRPVGEKASFEAAQCFMEVMRHIEYISNAESVYDNASSFQVQAGIGYWRVNTDYIDPRSFDQEIYIQPIKDPRAVYLDPDINEDDGSDARFGFIFNDMPKDLFDDKYPKFKNRVGWTTTFATDVEGWLQKNTVRVAEYYRRTQNDETLVAFIIPDVAEKYGEAAGDQVIKFKSELEDIEKKAYDELKQLNKENDKNDIETPDEFLIRERSVLTDNIDWYKIAGDIVIDKGPWLGKYVPIVRCVGTETIIDGILDRKGHTRALINAQQMYNYNCLDLDTKLPTPTGWTTIRDVKEGDYLISDEGKPTKVLGISPININRKCYKITFDSGAEIIADETHLWTVEERGKRKSQTYDWQTKTITTKELSVKNHFIKAVKPVDLNEAELPIHPYILGAWLGDGTTAANSITCSLDDALEMQELINSCGYKVGDIRINKDKSACIITIHGLRNDLINLGVLRNKHIPDIYLRSSKEQRQLLLQGLMDTDGCISKANNQCVFVNTNLKIISGIIELISSLGIKCKQDIVKAAARQFPNGETYNCQEAQRISFTANPDQSVFKLSRKLNIQQKDRNIHWRRTKRHGIKSIIEIPSVPVKCLTVDAPSKLFLAGEHWIPTHNTSANVEFGALQTKSPWVASMEAIEGFEEFYKTANTTNHSYLPYNGLDEQGNQIAAPTRPAAPQASMAYVRGMEIAQNEMMMASGQYQSQMGENENAKSGVAINARQRQGDRATYHFIDNQAKAIRFTGKILIDLIPKIYDTKRVMRISATDGSIIEMTIDPKAPQAVEKIPIDPNNLKDWDKKQQIVKMIFNPNVGMYDVQSEVGPSFATRRQEAFNALTQIAAQNKEFMNIAGDILWKVADFPEAQVLAERWRRVIPPNITGDAPDPAAEQAMQEASAKLEQQLAVIAQQSKELADKERELDIRQMDADRQWREAAATQSRLDYEAETKRLTALGNSGPALTREQIEPVVRQLLEAMLRAGSPSDVNEIDIEQIAKGLSKGGTPIEASVEAEPGEGEEPEESPMEGARKGKDNKWYVQQGNQWFMVQ